MGPPRKSKSVNKRYSNIPDVSPRKDGDGSKRSSTRKRKLTDMLGPRWSMEELARFYDSYRKNGKDWKKVSGAVRNRSLDMVEALYSMNRAYLSLPHGTASADGLIAMMTDHYSNLAGSDSDQESNDGAGPSRKTQKRALGKVKPPTSKALEEQFISPTLDSSYGCLSLFKKKRSGDEETAFDALQTLADLSLMMPIENEDVMNSEVGVGNEGQVGISGQPGQTGQPGEPPGEPGALVKRIPTRRARKPTRMARFTLRFPGKVKIQFDSRRLMAIGPKKKIIDNFISYMGFLGRKQPSILIKSWKYVPANTKELIWQAILEKFEIFIVDAQKEVEFSLVDEKLRKRFRRKWVNYVGRRWSVFKTNLTTIYIYGNKKTEPPYVSEYEFLDKETWDAFVALKLTAEEKAKRLKAQETQSNNKCPQRCSRGGYEVLTQKIIDEKYKARKEASTKLSEVIQPPSPPSRHETWKRARIKPSGEYINQETSAIAEKIDALEQDSGSFTPTGKNDILAVAIGKPDHPSRVRGVGTGYTVRTYFGKQGHSADGMVSREEVAVIVAEMKAQMQAEMRAEMMMMMSSQATSAAEPHTPVGNSAKESCAPEFMPSDQQDEQVVSDAGDYELYVEDPHKRLVAYGRIHELGSNIHHRQMNNDEVRVSVERVVVADATVPFPTEEVDTVGEALKQFIAWPRRLVVEPVKQVISQRVLFPKKSSQVNEAPLTQNTDKTDVLKTLWIAAADIKEPKNLCIEAGIVSLTRNSVYINQVDIMGLLATGTISSAVMKFYNRCLFKILQSSGRADRYGLMCPLTVQNHGNNEDMGLIRNRIGEGLFDCFLLPVYDKGWELMAICPKIGCVTSFSCLAKGKKQKKKVPEMIETAFEAYQVVKGMRSNTLTKPKWVYPKCCQQDVGDAECGLFVMRHMLEIIKLDIANSFEKVLNMEEPYSTNDIDDVRRRWAESFLEVI